MNRLDPRWEFIRTARWRDIRFDYMEKIEELLLDHPAEARHWAELLPEVLTPDDGPDLHSHGLILLAATRTATGAYELAAETFDQLFALEPPDTPFPYSAWRLAARTRYWIQQLDYRQATEDTEAGLCLLGKKKSPQHRTVRAHLLLNQYRVAAERGDWDTALEKAERALSEAPTRDNCSRLYPFGERARTAAALCLFSSLVATHPADALTLMQQRNLIPQRTRRGGYNEPRRSALVLIWAAGCLQAKLGQQKPAIDRLAWAAKHLAEIGAVVQAAHCAISLVSVESKDHPAACAVMQTLRDDPTVSEPLKNAAINWLASPAESDPVPRLTSALEHEEQRRRRYADAR